MKETLKLNVNLVTINNVEASFKVKAQDITEIV
jgi:hypothetical protein